MEILEHKDGRTAVAGEILWDQGISDSIEFTFAVVAPDGPVRLEHDTRVELARVDGSRGPAHPHGGSPHRLAAELAQGRGRGCRAFLRQRSHPYNRGLEARLRHCR